MVVVVGRGVGRGHDRGAEITIAVEVSGVAGRDGLHSGVRAPAVEHSPPSAVSMICLHICGWPSGELPLAALGASGVWGRVRVT